MENAKTLLKEVSVDIDYLHSREDLTLNSVIEEAIKSSEEEAIAKIIKLAQLFRAKRELPQSITKGTIFSQPGEKGVIPVPCIT